MNPVRRVIVTIQVQSNGGFNNRVLNLTFFDAIKNLNVKTIKK